MEIKIETDLNGETHLVKYDNDDGYILMTDTFENCKNELIKIIKSRHRNTHITFYGSGDVMDHSENKIIKGKEFCGL